MNRTRWEDLQAIFHEALQYPAEERHTYITSACGEDVALVSEVLEMLKEDQENTSLLDRGVAEIAFLTINTSFRPYPSQQFGPYRLKQLLGEGGMGVVWLAQRIDTGNLVAIKFLLHAGLSPARRERFTREIKIVAKLKHPFIARLYDAGALPDGTPWFVMEYIDGEGFVEFCRGKKTIEEQLRLFCSVCEAVQYAHSQEIIHRDLKPSNILVAKDGTPHLLDFGIARELQPQDADSGETRPGLRFLSPDYAAPEWLHEGSVGFYTDVYSLGVILYEILTGRKPAVGAQAPSNGERSAGPAPEKPSVAILRTNREAPANGGSRPQSSWLHKDEWNDLDVLCLKAAHADPHQRYQSVETLLRDVCHYLNAQPLEARRDTLGYRLRKFVRRNRRAVFASTAALLLFASLIGFYTFRLTQAYTAQLKEAARTRRVQRFMFNLFQGGDKDAGPSEDLRVVTLVDRGVLEAQALKGEPEVQSELYETLGTVYQRLGNLPRADALLQSALQERRHLAKSDGVAVANSLIALSLLRSDQEQSQAAERLAREALAEVQARHSRDRPLLAKALSALGHVLVEAGHYQEGEKVLDHAVALQSDLDAFSPELALTLTDLADAHLYLGDYKTAVEINGRALAVDQKIYGKRHPHIADDLANLGEIQVMWGHYAEAENYQRQAIDMTQAWYGNDHPDTAGKMTSLAGTLIYQNRYSEAEELLKQALATRRRVYGEENAKVAYVLNLLGSIANKRSDFRDAEKDFELVARDYQAAYGAKDYRVAVASANLASVYFKEKEYSRAEALYGKAIEGLAASLPQDNINIGITQMKLGRTLLAERQYQAAEQHSRRGYEILLKQVSPSTSFLQGVRQDLFAIYTALKRPDEAKRFGAEIRNGEPTASTAATLSH